MVDQKKDEESIFTRFKEKFESIDITLLFILSCIIALISFAISYRLEELLFEGDIPRKIKLLFTSINCLFFCFPGIIILLRRESPGPLLTIKEGVVPIIEGLLWILFVIFLSIKSVL